MSGRSSRLPAWAVVCTIVGAVLMLISGGMVLAGEWVAARYDLRQEDLFGEEEFGRDIEGPVNILLAGLDTRPSRPDEAGRTDAVMIVHVPAGLDRGYLISLPRDLLVEIPAMPEVDYPGGTDRLNSAMFHGAQQLDGEQQPNLPRGFQLLADTVSDLTGVADWDAGAVIDFEGFQQVVDALGGVSIELDEPVESRHRQPDGSHRPLAPDGDGFHGPQMVYEPGVPPCAERRESGGPFQCELNGWQALDIARQRYSLSEGDFARQQNQQRLLQAIMARAASRDITTNPVALDRVLRSAGDSLMFDGRGHRAVDFAFALRNLRPDDLTMVSLPTHSVGAGAGYQGEELDPAAEELFAALRTGDLERFLTDNRDFVQ